MEARGTGGHSRRARLPLALAVAVASAAAATLLLRPRGGIIEPAAVDAQSYFTALQLDRAEDFRDIQRLITLGGLVLSSGTLALVAWRPPLRVFDRIGRRPILGAATVGAGLSLLLVVVDLPLSAWSHQRAVDVGLSTQDWLDWFADLGKSAAIGAGFAALGAALALALVRRFRRNWWAPAAVVVVAFGVVTIWLFPVVIDPIFNDFQKLPPGPTRSDVLELADKAGVDVGEVYRVDASRRTTAANAYVNGLGHSKRVVLFDNLITGFPRDQVRLVVAHELGHQKHNDLLRGLAWLALVAPAGTFLAQRLAEAFGRRYGLGTPDRKPGPAALPAIALAITLAAFGFGVASNVLSRQVEARADAFSLRLTDDPGSFIQFHRGLAVRNITDPDPPGFWTTLFGTHPTTLQRIGTGVVFDRDR
ncbi:MAG: M48 family metalloprotease [Thermoleophilaceae bacterium]|nr:M48 family metalloprotease [Thermoleophilaceae bacterium]